MEISERIMGIGFFVGLFGTLFSAMVALTFILPITKPIWDEGLIALAVFGGIWASSIAYGQKKGYLILRKKR